MVLSKLVNTVTYSIQRLYHLDGAMLKVLKCVNCLFFFLGQHIPNFIVNIQTTGQRIVVSDIQDSFHFLRYKRQENQLVIFADDTCPRWLTCSCLLDYNTVAGADKFGNVTVVRNMQLFSFTRGRIYLYLGTSTIFWYIWLKSFVLNP